MGFGAPCGVAREGREAAGRPLWPWVGPDLAGAEPGAGSRSVDTEALTAMGRGSLRARGSQASLLLLLLLWLPLQVSGTEAFQGEWDVPRGAGQVTVRGWRA